MKCWRFWRAALAALVALLIQHAALARMEHGAGATGAPSLSAAATCSADQSKTHRPAPGFPVHACDACLSCSDAAVRIDPFHPASRRLAFAGQVIGLPDQCFDRRATPEAAAHAPRAPPASA